MSANDCDFCWAGGGSNATITQYSYGPRPQSVGIGMDKDDATLPARTRISIISESMDRNYILGRGRCEENKKTLR